MARNDDKPPRKRRPAAGRASGATPSEPGLPRILVIEHDATWRTSLARAVEALPARCDMARSVTQGRTLLERDSYDVLVLDLDHAHRAALDLARQLSQSASPTRVVFTTSRATLDAAVDAMRHGAADLLGKPIGCASAAARILAAAKLAQSARRRERTIDRLSRTCSQLVNEREEMGRQVGVMCGDLAEAYHDLAEKADGMTLAGEFGAVVRQELDIESLLRATLEFVLGRVGPTNAAIFLPTGGSDYSLGAYVNYSIPRDTAEVLLDHLADVLPSRFEREEAVTTLKGEDQIADRLDAEAGWIGDSVMIVAPCLRDGECLAVMTLFRDRRAEFAPEIARTLRVIRDLFTEQLARVIAVHHRHRPDKSGRPYGDVGDEDAGGLAA